MEEKNGGLNQVNSSIRLAPLRIRAVALCYVSQYRTSCKPRL